VSSSQAARHSHSKEKHRTNPMSHITKFTVTGLAGRTEDVTIELDRKLNVFYGLNGSGKTSLLRILHSAMQGDGSSLADVPFQSATVWVYSIQHNTVFMRSIAKPKSNSRQPTALVEFNMEWTREAQRTRLPRWKLSNVEQTMCGGEKPTAWSHRYLPITRLQAPSRIRPEFLSAARAVSSGPGAEVPSEQQIDRYFADLVQQLWRAYSHEILRKVRAAQEEGLASILHNVLAPLSRRTETSVADPREAYESVKKFLARQTSESTGLGPIGPFLKRYGESTQLQQVVSEILIVEQKIVEATAKRDQLSGLLTRLYGGGKSISVGEGTIEIKAASGDVIDLAFLSSGEKHVLRLLVEALCAESNTLMIDEPELSLHIDWQRELVRAIQNLNEGAQLVLATHSPEVMADIPDKNIIQI
jgi:predicted ATPase